MSNLPTNEKGDHPMVASSIFFQGTGYIVPVPLPMNLRGAPHPHHREQIRMTESSM